MVNKLFFLFFAFLLSACSIHEDPLNNAMNIGVSSGFEQLVFKTSYFDQFVFLKNVTDAGKIVVYIEGDGSAWARRYKPSDDPSPRNPLALRMAVLDPQPVVAYVARPCQFTGGDDGRGCDTSFWTSHRFAREVVLSTEEVIDKLKDMTGVKKVELVGYSGGGAVALLVASERTDVISVRTVAGNIDHKAWTDYHSVSPLYGSLNPADAVEENCSIPQLHYVGDEDRIMPLDIAKAYQKKATAFCRSRVRVIPGCTHAKGWVEVWPSLCAGFYKTESVR